MKQGKRKVLIVKSGYSETFVSDRGRVCSLGDVFRTTVLLNLLKNDDVTWVTDAAALFLLKGNRYIKQLIAFDENIESRLNNNRYDIVINLERDTRICSMAGNINAAKRYGFWLNEVTGEIEIYGNDSGTVVADDPKKLNGNSWEQSLFLILGAKWKGESSILGYKPTSSITHDIGFNIHVGSKFPIKAWPQSNWERLEELLLGKYTFSRQRHLNDLKGYINWISSCRLLITNDSLGLHLGVVLGKKVLALLGPTSASHLSCASNLKILTPALERECIPCYKSECSYNDICMDYIFPEAVFDAIDRWTVG